MTGAVRTGHAGVAAGHPRKSQPGPRTRTVKDRCAPGVTTAWAAVGHRAGLAGRPR